VQDIYIYIHIHTHTHKADDWRCLDDMPLEALDLLSPAVWDNTEDVQATFPEDARAVGESGMKLPGVRPCTPGWLHGLPYPHPSAHFFLCLSKYH